MTDPNLFTGICDEITSHEKIKYFRNYTGIPPPLESFAVD